MRRQFTQNYSKKVYTIKFYLVIKHLKQQTSPASRRQPETWNFFAVLTAHIQQVGICR